MDKKEEKPKEQKNIVSSVSSGLAALALKEAWERGETIEIPSLGIKIKKFEPAPTASEYAWW